MRPRSTPLLLARLTLFIAEKGLSAAAAVARIAREALEEPAREADAAPAPEPARRERADGRPQAPAPEPEHVDEPWDGYRSMTANDIRARLADADAEVAAAVKLYEGMHKDRSSVVEAADRRLRG